MACGTASAQKTHYQGEVVINYGFGVGNVQLARTGVHLINGLRFNPYLSTGVRIGVDYSYAGNEESYLSLPLYVDLKAYTSLSPTVSLYAWVVRIFRRIDGRRIFRGFPPISKVYDHSRTGVSIKTTEKTAINWGVCYINQKCTLSYRNESTTTPTNAIGIKMGLIF